MAVWEWIAVGLGLLVLLQLVALQYARQMGSEDREASPRATPGAGTDAVPVREPEPAGSDDTVVCSSCGTQNDPAFTFCRECVSPIG